MPFSSGNDFHDAILNYVSLDYEKKEVSICLSAYENQDSKNRTQVLLNFQEVKRYSSISNMDIVSDNGISGNVNYLSIEHRITYLHLLGGAIEVEAKDMKISVVP